MWQSLQQPLRSCLSHTCRCPAVDGSRERLAPEVYHRLRTQKAATARDETRNRAKAVAKAAVKDGHLRNTEVQRTRAAAEHQRKLAAQVKAQAREDINKQIRSLWGGSIPSLFGHVINSASPIPQAPNPEAATRDDLSSC